MFWRFYVNCGTVKNISYFDDSNRNVKFVYRQIFTTSDSVANIHWIIIEWLSTGQSDKVKWTYHYQ